MSTSDLNSIILTENPVNDEEFLRLPLQLQIAFTTRCALRVLPLIEGYADAWNENGTIYLQSVSSLIFWSVVASADPSLFTTASAKGLPNSIRIAHNIADSSPVIRSATSLGNAVHAACAAGSTDCSEDLLLSFRSALISIYLFDRNLFRDSFPDIKADLDRLLRSEGVGTHKFVTYYKTPLWIKSHPTVQQAMKRWNQKSHSLGCQWVSKLYSAVCSGRITVEKLANVLKNPPVAIRVPGVRIGVFQGVPGVKKKSLASVPESGTQDSPSSNSKQQPRKNVLEAEQSSLSPAPIQKPHTSGFVSDGASASDHLGFERYVDAFARLLCAKETQLPCSVGLFGLSGTGKSSFLEQLSARIDLVARALPKVHSKWAVERVAQVKYDPCRHPEGELWPSLANGILDGIAVTITEKNGDKRHDSLHETRSALARGLESSRRGLEEARSRHRTLVGKRTRILQLQRGLETIDSMRSQFDKSKSRAKKLFGDQLLGPASLQKLYSILAFQKETAFLRRLLLLAGIYGSVAMFLITAPWMNEGVSGLWAVCAASIPFIWLLAAWAFPIRRSFGEREESLRTLLLQDAGETEKMISTLSGPNISEPVSQYIGGVITSCKSRILVLDREIEEAATAIGHFESGGIMYDLEGRTVSKSELRNHHGLLSTVRTDMEHLGKLLAEHGKETGAHWRVVVLIDHLDRCSQSRAVEVLQAVHLLLAFDLFAVVVASDFRWLESAVNTLFSGYGTRASTPCSLENGPRSFLEKLFQIPFVIPELRGGSYGTLIENLVFTGVDGEMHRNGSPLQTEKTSVVPSSSSKTGMPGSQEIYEEDTESLRYNPPESPFSGIATAETVAFVPGGKVMFTAQGSPESVQSKAAGIEPREYAALSLLGPFFRTPRRVKRFVNTYRLLRSTVPDERFKHFCATDHAGAMLLLAILINYPELSEGVLQSLTSGDIEPAMQLSDFVKKLHKDPDESDSVTQRAFVELRKRLLSNLHAGNFEAVTVGTMAPWAGEAGRYIFG